MCIFLSPWSESPRDDNYVICLFNVGASVPSPLVAAGDSDFVRLGDSSAFACLVSLLGRIFSRVFSCLVCLFRFSLFSSFTSSFCHLFLLLLSLLLLLFSGPFLIFSVTWFLPLVVSWCRFGLVLRLFLLFVSSFVLVFPSDGSSVPTANVVLGVATLALGGVFGRCVLTVCFSLVPVPEIHWLLHLLFFLDTDDTILSFCHQSHDPFPLSFVVGYSEKRAGQPDHAGAAILV